jgi:hypothetical protein
MDDQMAVHIAGSFLVKNRIRHNGLIGAQFYSRRSYNPELPFLEEESAYWIVRYRGMAAGDRATDDGQSIVCVKLGADGSRPRLLPGIGGA